MRTHAVIAHCVGSLTYRTECDRRTLCLYTKRPLRDSADYLLKSRLAAYDDILTFQHGEGDKVPITVKTTVGHGATLEI